MPAETCLSSLISQTHGRQRREERGIEKIDLQRARKYGMREKARNGRLKFTYGGVVFIYDPYTNREVTSWKSSDISRKGADMGAITGTRAAKPIMLKKKEVDFTYIRNRPDVRLRLLSERHKWTSHSVLVCDMSGSMRRDDLNGAKCRSDGVWMSLARDYVKTPLENGTRSQTDLISIIVMRDKAELLLLAEPTDWCLYNKLLEFREWEEIRPSGPGNYMPALDMAESLLDVNTMGSCALALLFFSDGKPSDYGDHEAKIGSLASKFGRRLSITCLGMAAEEDEETFSTLRGMACEAESYGSVASFGSAGLDVDSLSKIISSLATSLTDTKTEMTDMASGKSLSVRMDIRRERQGAPDDLYLTNDWKVYEKSRYGRTWIWSYKHDGYVELFDFRCVTCNADTRSNTRTIHLKGGAILCPVCKSACFCDSHCFVQGHSDHVRGNILNMDCCADMRIAAIEKRIVKRPVPSYCIAVKEQIFGEGAERIVSKLRYLDDFHRFHGPKLVAKESRHILSREQSYKAQENFHATFMRTQAIASEMAKQFNQDIDALVNARSDPKWREIVRKMPRMHFLEPQVTEVWAKDTARTAEYYLIEPYLEGKYVKFNSNNGFVKGINDTITEGKTESPQGVDLAAMMNQLEIDIKKMNSSMQTLSNKMQTLSSGGLDIIEECDESDGDEDNFLRSKTKSNSMASLYRDVKDEHIPQAFSHYSYVKSKKRLMVVDLQGVLETHSDGTKSYNLTDPVIHKRKSVKEYKGNFGKTNRGDKGIKAFMDSHECSDVCKMLGLKNLS